MNLLNIKVIIDDKDDVLIVIRNNNQPWSMFLLFNTILFFPFIYSCFISDLFTLKSKLDIASKVSNNRNYLNHYLLAFAFAFTFDFIILLKSTNIIFKNYIL